MKTQAGSTLNTAFLAGGRWNTPLIFFSFGVASNRVQHLRHQVAPEVAPASQELSRNCENACKVFLLGARRGT